MSKENFYYNVDLNKYVPIKTDLDILHSNKGRSAKNSDNKIGLVYNNELNTHQFKSMPKHMKLKDPRGEFNDSNDSNESVYSDYFDPSEYYSDIEISDSDSNSNDSSKNSNDSSDNDKYSNSNYSSNSNDSDSDSDNLSVVSKESDNIFKQRNELDIKLLGEINYSLEELNNQFIRVCNKKKGMNNVYRNLINSKIIDILNQCGN